ncbi:hypothetical protein H7I03_16795 [Mycobacterium sherrisii]|nr:hypothetical protein [Mycobacterium sherrisii]
MSESHDANDIIDVEAIEIEGSDNLPAVIEASTRPRMENRAGVPRWSEEWWTQASAQVQARRCVAHKSNGDRCLKAAIKGATVCRTHGGATRHVRNAARVRLENAADLMSKQLLGIALTADSESVKLAAIKDALDRAGLKPPAEVVLAQGEPKKFEAVFDSIGGDPEAAGFSSATSEDSITAGVDASPAPAYDRIAEQAEHSSPDDPLRQGRRREVDRDRQPRPSDVLITGEVAMRVANEANLNPGAVRPPLALPSPHKRYRRP